MGLKILIVPLLLVVTLFLAIVNVKPLVEEVFTKKSEIKLKEAQVTNIDTIVSNVEKLVDVLDTERSTEDFSYRYLPKSIDQDRTIDSFNYLASQSGLFISAMELKEVPEVVREEVSVAGNANIPKGEKAASVKAFVFKGSVIGSYDSIKSFYDRLSHTERFQRLHFFSLESNESAEKLGQGSLEGIFEVEYGYLPAQSVLSALNLPVFSRSTIDLLSSENMMKWMTSAVPPLERGVTGKPSPFQ
ncbi:MAG: hypothetical protein HYV45_01245 [Candidatus Moranbacteria bacterium]|nr:hypothetical protein [Candidatus Moranbacteria bacterium]